MLLDKDHLQEVNGVQCPSLKEDDEVITAILNLSSLTNGELSHRAMPRRKRTGLHC
jgi:nitrate reductase alpha subunit